MSVKKIINLCVKKRRPPFVLEDSEQQNKVFDPMMVGQSSRIAAHRLGFDFCGCELATKKEVLALINQIGIFKVI